MGATTPLEPAEPSDGLWNVPSRRLLAAFALTSAVGGLLTATGTSQHRDAQVPLELRIDLNSAPAEVIATLPRLGPALTGRILEAREEAPFRSLDDLDRRVRGIGPATIAGLRPYLRLPENDPDDP